MRRPGRSSSASNKGLASSGENEKGKRRYDYTSCLLFYIFVICFFLRLKACGFPRIYYIPFSIAPRALSMYACTPSERERQFSLRTCCAPSAHFVRGTRKHFARALHLRVKTKRGKGDMITHRVSFFTSSCFGFTKRRPAAPARPVL